MIGAGGTSCDSLLPPLLREPEGVGGGRGSRRDRNLFGLQKVRYVLFLREEAMRRPGPGPGYEGKKAEPSRRVLQRRFPDLVVSKHKSVLRELMTKGKALANPGVVAKGVQNYNVAGEGRMKPKDRVLKLKKPIARKQTKKAAEMTLGSPNATPRGLNEAEVYMTPSASPEEKATRRFIVTYLYHLAKIQAGKKGQ